MRMLIVGIAAVALIGCDQIKGSGVKTSDKRSVGAFSKVEVRGAADVNFKVGSTRSVTVTTDDNLQSHILTRVEGDTLIIETKGSISSHIGFNVAVVNPKLSGVSISGSGDIEAGVIRSGAFSATVSGSGDIKVRGTATNIAASISGSGTIDLSSLQATTAKASIAGSGDIDLNVSSSLNASIAGSGDISYLGSPRVTKSISGSGDVHRR